MRRIVNGRHVSLRRICCFVIVGMLGLTALSLGCYAVLVAIQRGPGRAGASGGFWVEGCAGLAVAPRLQVGIVWVSPASSYLPSLAYSPYAVCVDILLPTGPGRLYGEWLFPP